MLGGPVRCWPGVVTLARHAGSAQRLLVRVAVSVVVTLARAGSADLAARAADDQAERIILCEHLFIDHQIGGEQALATRPQPAPPTLLRCADPLASGDLVAGPARASLELVLCDA